MKFGTGMQADPLNPTKSLNFEFVKIEDGGRLLF